MVNDATIMDMFMRAVAWQNFADTMATEADIREADMESQLELAEIGRAHV